jgi:hypothetical protein
MHIFRHTSSVSMFRHACHTLPTTRSYATLTRRFRTVKTQEWQTKKKELSIPNFNVSHPAVFKGAFDDIPATEKWFTKNGTFRYPSELNMKYLKQYGDAIVPLEVTRAKDDAGKNETFERFEAPLSLLLQHMSSTGVQVSRLYLAQHELADLPAVLQEDLPTPTTFLSHLNARGDIYASSLWMGKPPTRTPLHRDPNPNLFVQLAGKKTIRLMKPEVGAMVYARVRQQIHGAGGKANMRGEEMMQGSEMEALETAVWGGDEAGMDGVPGLEATLRSGDALYIPLGWWHAVRGIGRGANASVSLYIERRIGKMLIVMFGPTGGSAEHTVRCYSWTRCVVHGLTKAVYLTSTLTVTSDPSTHVPIDLVPGTISTSLITLSIPISASLSSESHSSSAISVMLFLADTQSPVSQINLHFIGLILKCLPTIPRMVYAVLLIGISASNVVDLEVAR